jgi:hypothetical protein
MSPPAYLVPNSISQKYLGLISSLTLKFYQLKIPNYSPILNLLKHLRVHNDWFAQRFSLYSHFMLSSNYYLNALNYLRNW